METIGVIQSAACGLGDHKCPFGAPEVVYDVPRPRVNLQSVDTPKPPRD